MSTYNESSTYDSAITYGEEREEGRSSREVLAEELYDLKKDGFDIL